MTQEEILEYNKRCAEFLGCVLQENGMYKYTIDFPITLTRSKGGLHLPTEWLEFHSNWNWIMEVVKAIEKHNISYVMGRSVKNTFNIESDGIKICYHPNNNYLLHLELKPYLLDGGWEHPMYKSHIIQQFDFKTKSKEEAVVQAICQFLIWYNENK